METSSAVNLPAPYARVTAVRNPFTVQRDFAVVLEGRSIADILADLKYPPRVWPHIIVLFDGTAIRREFWHCARPKPGVRVIVNIFPTGSGNNLLRTLLIVAVAAAAVWFAPGAAALGTSLAGGFGVSAGTVAAAQAGLFAVGMLAVNALVPPARPKFDTGTTSSPTLSIAASQNELRPFGTMPMFLGKHRYWPPYAAKPYTELVGKDQYLRLLFLAGYKDMEVSQFKLGENDLFSYDDVEVEIACGSSNDSPFSQITLFTESVDEVLPGAKLVGPGSPTEQTTSTNTDEFSLDLTAPNGLIRIDKSGDEKTVAVSITLEYKLASDPDTSYVLIDTIPLSAKSPETIRKGYRFKFPARDQYTVRVTRTTDDQETSGSDQTYQDDVYLSAFRSITNENPVKHPDAALIAIRIKATDQLNGTVSDFNFVGSSIVPDYDSATQSWISRETNNPASLFRFVLEGKGNARPLQPLSLESGLDGQPIDLIGVEDDDAIDVGLTGGNYDRVHLDEIEAWHNECRLAGRAFNMVRDFTATVWETLQDIAAAGRARPRHINGLWSAVRDIPQTEARQHFTPRNSWGFTATKQYIHMPHAFRIRFLNEDEGYGNDERLVYDDGYDEDNATRFETLELPGVTDPDQIWKDGRYHIAVARLRPEVFQFNADIEHIAVTQGDLIRFMHDTILVGLGSGRITAVTDDGNDILSITLDESLDMEAGKSYSVRVRFSETLLAAVYPVTTVPGTTKTLTFQTPITIPVGGANVPAVGDLWMFGETGLDSMELIVDSISPLDNLSATLKCYDAAPGVHVAADGPIPAFESHITYPAGAVKPVIEKAISDESVLLRAPDGSLQARILLSLGFVNNRIGVRDIEIQYKVSYAGDWSRMSTIPGDSVSASIINVTEGETYQIRARYRFLDNTDGEWSTTFEHTVVGKTTPPPPVQAFYVVRQADGTREFTWKYPDPPNDIAGFRVKYRLGASGADWDTNMIELLDGPAIRKSVADGLLAQSPFETNQLQAGVYQIGIAATDSIGLESEPIFINSTLGDPRIAKALYARDEMRFGWPGTLTDCHVNDVGALAPDDNTTWSDLVSLYGPDFEDLTGVSWSPNPVSSMTYQTATIDIGGVVQFDPQCTVHVASGTVTIEEQHSDDNMTYSSWAALGGPVTTRYIRFRVTITTPPVTGVTSMLVVLSADVDEETVSDLDTSLVHNSAGDLNVPLVGSYNLITSVQVALQNVGAGWTWEVIDKNAAGGPHIKIYDDTKTLADAVIDVVVKGL